MTVCVAAFAAKSKAIVLVSDKALTYAGAGMQSDTSVKKILPIGSSTWHALVAGDSTFADEIIAHCSRAIEVTPEIAEEAEALIKCVTEGYQAHPAKADHRASLAAASVAGGVAVRSSNPSRRLFPFCVR